MKGSARVVLVLLGLLFAAGGLYALALLLNLVPDYGTSLVKMLDRPVLAAAGAGLIVIAVLFLSLGLRPSKPALPETILQTSEYGEIRITITAIEIMVLRVVQQTQGVKDNGRRVSYSPDGLIIQVRIKVMPDLQLPELVNGLQVNVKNYVEEITGIIVHEGKVLVENIVLDQVPIKKRA